MGVIRIKQIYDAPASTDGKRVLVDRIWPRGVSKEFAKLDLWRKEVAPSTDLRKWLEHNPARFEEFRNRYRQEMEANYNAVSELDHRSRENDITLLYAAHDKHIKHANVLAEFFEEERSEKTAGTE